MKSKQTIIYIIDSLGTGGAEILLNNTVNYLTQYDYAIIYLNKPDELKVNFPGEIGFYCMEFKNWSQVLFIIRKIKRVISKYNPVLVHSHLQTSTLIARLAVPANIPLITTIHSIYSKDAFSKNKLALLVEKFTCKRSRALITVSNHVLADYLKHVKYPGKTYVLYNFVPGKFFSNFKTEYKSDSVFRCLAIGSLNESKNYPYLIQLISKLKDVNITLDIYGEGPLHEDLKKMIAEYNLPVFLRGKVVNIPGLMSGYDLFIQASSHEGFGLTVAEAMAARLPVFISDIPVFREITNEYAHFFPLDNPTTAANQLEKIIDDKEKRIKHVEAALNNVRDKYTLQQYADKLIRIYKEIVPTLVLGFK